MPRDSAFLAVPPPLLAAAFAGLLLLAYAVAVSAAQLDPAYFSDGWWMLRWIREFERGELSFAGYILHPHGEHYHAVILGLYLLDWKLFGGTQTFIAVAGFASSVAVFAVIAVAVWRSPGAVLYRAAAILFAATLIASLQGFETWYLPFQAVLSTGRFLSVLCIMLVAYGVSTGRNGFAYAGAVLGSIAIFAHGTVLPLVFVIPGLPLLCRRWKAFAATLLVPVGFLTIILPYVLGLIHFADKNSPTLFAPSRLLEILRGAAVLVGGAFARDIPTAEIIGWAGLAAACAVGLLAVRAAGRNRDDVSWGVLFFIGLGALSLADAVLAAVLNVLRSNYYGPIAYDYASMLASRYFMTATGVWVSLAALGATLPRLRSAPRIAIVGAALLCGLAVFVQVKSVEAVRDVHIGTSVRRGHAALLADVYDPDAMTALIRPGDFQEEVPGWNKMMRERAQNIHAVTTPAISAERIAVVGEGTPTAGGCKFIAAVTVDHPPGPPPGVVRFDGGAMAYQDRALPAHREDFDAAAYQRDNPDVAHALGADPQALWGHWMGAGLMEGRKAPVREGGAVMAVYDGYSARPCDALGLGRFSP